MRLLTALAVLLLISSSLPAQTPSQQSSRLDTVTVYGMQFRIVAMSTTRTDGARSSDVRSYRASTLESEGYTQLGGFYINEWRDPVTLDTMKRAVAIAESPESIGMENSNVVGGAILLAGCDGDEAAVQIRTPEPLTGDLNGEIDAEYRFAGARPIEDAAAWHVGAAGQWAGLYDDEARNFLLSFGQSDSLYIRLTGATGDNATHAFDLEAAPKVHYRMGCLR